MNNFKPKSSGLNYWLKQPSLAIGLLGIGALTALPVLSQSYYPPMVFFQPLAYPNYPQRSENSNLINTLESSTNFQNLTAEIKAAGLAEKLQQEQLTVLAPSDEAFNALSDEDFDKFSEPKNRLKVLQYHLVAGKVEEEDIKSGTLKTLAGEEVSVSNADNALLLGQAEAQFPPTIATNGVIIEIDRVLLPPDFRSEVNR